jgi:AcrR family transcriptional regulator
MVCGSWHTGDVPVDKLTPERRRQMTRDALLDAAEEVFVRRGVPGAPMEEIAAEAGFSRGAIYAHFGSKDDLLLAVMDRFTSRQLDEFLQLEHREDPIAAAIDAADLFRQSFSTELVPLDLELRMNAMRHPALRQRLVEADRRMSEATARLVEKMVGDADNLRIPARDLADLGRAAVIGLLQYAAVDEEQRGRYESLVESLFLLLTEALSDEKPNPSAPARRGTSSRRRGRDR